MKGTADPRSLGIDPVGTAGGLGAVAGAVSLLWPFFCGMTAALVALAVVGWLPRIRRPRGAGPNAPPTEPWVVFLLAVAIAIGWAYFLLAPGEWSLGRGLVLGAAGGGVGWVGRRRPAFGEGSG